MNQYKRLLKNILLLLSGNFVTKVLSFLMVPFYTSILSTADYGVADLISTTVLLVLPGFSLLMDEAIMRFALDKANDKKQVFTIAMSLSTIGFFVALCVSPIILLFGNLRPYYWFVILYYVSLWLYNIFSNFVKGMDKIAIVTTAGIIHTFAYLGINIVCLAVFRWGVVGYLLAIDLSNIIATVFLVISCGLHRNFISVKNINWKLAEQMIKYSVPMIPDYISWWINNCSDRYMIAAFLGTAATGVYSVAYKIPTILNSLTSIFSSAWKISSVEQFGSEESIKFYNRTYRIYSAFLMISGSCLILITKFLATILFARDFFEAWKITPILILSYIFSAQAIFVGSIFTASKKTKILFVSSLSGATINILLNLLMIPVLKENGAAIATCIGYVVILTVNIVNTRKILDMDFNLKRNIIAYSVMIVEMALVHCDNVMGYVLAMLCVLIIILLNVNELKSLISISCRKSKKLVV